MTQRWLLRFALLLPALVVITAAMSRLASGAALERVFPATAYILLNASLPASSYGEIADILSETPPGDGETELLRAEAAVGAGTPAPAIIPLVKAALSVSPGDARGWLLLASLSTAQEPKEAAAALSVAFQLAPHDYYLRTPRAFVGAALWSYLPDEARAELLGEARLIATDPERRSDLRALLAKRGGPELVTRAFAGHPDTLKTLNRSLTRETLGLP